MALKGQETEGIDEPNQNHAFNGGSRCEDVLMMALALATAPGATVAYMKHSYETAVQNRTILRSHCLICECLFASKASEASESVLSSDSGPSNIELQEPPRSLWSPQQAEKIKLFG